MKLKLPKLAIWSKIPDRLKLFLPGIIISLVIAWVQVGKKYYLDPQNRPAPVAYGRVQEFFKLPPGVYLSPNQRVKFDEINSKYWTRAVELLLEEDGFLKPNQIKTRLKNFRLALDRGEWGEKLMSSYFGVTKPESGDGLRLERVDKQWMAWRKAYEEALEELLSQRQLNYIALRSENPKTPVAAPPTNLDIALTDMSDEDRSTFPIKDWKKNNPELLQPVLPSGSPSLKTVVRPPKEESEEREKLEPVE